MLTYAQYSQLFWRTDAHGFFSRPYLLSWNLFEALACATPLVLSESVAYRSTVPETTDAVWVSLDKPLSITAGIRQRLTSTTRKN